MWSTGRMYQIEKVLTQSPYQTGYPGSTRESSLYLADLLETSAGHRAEDSFGEGLDGKIIQNANISNNKEDIPSRHIRRAMVGRAGCRSCVWLLSCDERREQNGRWFQQTTDAKSAKTQ